jgi:hypothetical protein
MGNKLEPRQLMRANNNLTYKIQEEEPDIVNHIISLNGTVPSLYRMTGPFILDEILDLIKAKHPDHILDWLYDDQYHTQRVIRFLVDDSHVIVKNRKTFEADDKSYDIDKKRRKRYSKRGSYKITGEFDLFYDCAKVDISKIVTPLVKSKLKSNTNFNKLHLICQDPEGGLYTKEFPLVNNNGEYSFDLDLHYGEGFAKFHETNIKRIKDSTKGIVLLHGSPGTGKSFYIKRLILDLVDKNKKILYLPNNMVGMLGTPSFNNFLLDFIDDEDELADMFDYDNEKDKDNLIKNKKGILMIIEDAEAVLLKRENNPHGSDGVANILNSTDGILNDFLNIQLLATFNTSIQNIDEAILRKKRALSVREFKKLTKEEAQKLIDFLKIQHTATGDMSIADIYALRQDDDDKVLFEAPKSTKMGFR